MNLLLFNLKTDADDGVLGFTTDWVNALATHFDRVIVVTMQTGRVVVADNVEVYSVGREKGYSEARRLFEFYRLLVGILRTTNIDVCFAHMMPLFTVLGYPMLRLRRIPIVLWYAHKSVTSTLKLAHVLAARVVTSGPEGFQIPSSKVRYVGQGISLGKFSHARLGPAGPFTMVSVGRLSEIKNVAGIIRAFARVVTAHPAGAVKLVLVGGPLQGKDEVYARTLPTLCEELGVRELVHFTGEVRHGKVGEWVSQADLMVSLSETMSLDKAILECLAAGVPCVVYNRAFTPVFKDAGVDPTPFVLEGNDPVIVAKAIEHWIEQGTRHAADLERVVASVREHHGLDGLARRIVRELKDVVGQS
jgi:glycosyltransferase involved in cell wall biosynthesis